MRIFKKARCWICGSRDWKEDLSYVTSYNIYGETKYYYHETCHRAALANPERWGHKSVDWALTITDYISYRDKAYKRKMKQIEKARQTLNIGEQNG